MAEFIWKQYPDSGWCLSCMSSTNDRGFVDLIGEALIKREEGSEEVVGVIDIHYCGDCLEQAARLVGCASRNETEEMAYQIIERDNEIEKLKDEIQAWSQRFEQLLDDSFAEKVRGVIESQKEK